MDDEQGLIEQFRDAFIRHVFFPKVKIPYWTFRKLRSLKSRQIGKDKGWPEWLSYITRNEQLEPTIHERAQEGTSRKHMQMWMTNFADNLPFIRYGDSVKLEIPANYHCQTLIDLAQPPPIFEGEPDYDADTSKPTEFIGGRFNEGVKVKHPPAGSAVVVGRGPSLFQHNHLQLLHDSNYQGLIVASDGGLIPCLEADIIPDVVVTVDGSPTIKQYFDHPLVKEHGKQIKWIASVTVAHEVYLAAHAAGIQTYWFNPTFDDWRQNESWTRLQVMMTKTPELDGVPRSDSGGNAGAFAWIVAHELFKRAPVALIGVDFGYPEGTPLQETQYYSSVLEMAHGDVAIIKEAYREFYHPDFKQKAYADFIFYHYRQAFLEMQMETASWFRLFGGTVNCTEGGTLFGTNIRCIPFAQFLKENPK